MAVRYWFEDGGKVYSTTSASDTRRGECSGIPRCCISFFKTATARERAKAVRLGWGYIPCPECVRVGKRIKVRDCAKRKSRCTCGAWKNRRLEGHI